MKASDQYRRLAQRIRGYAVKMTNCRSSGHVGSSLSMAEIEAVLYGRILRVDPANPRWPERDRFILSKGHAAAGVYGALVEKGFFPRSGSTPTTGTTAGFAGTSATTSRVRSSPPAPSGTACPWPRAWPWWPSV
jgi:transketolase N-terminal domain/subunit